MHTHKMEVKFPLSKATATMEVSDSTESTALQILNAQEAVDKLMSIQKYLIWMCDGWNEGVSEAVSLTQTAYASFLESEGKILLKSHCSMYALQLAIERAGKWEQIADFVNHSVEKKRKI